MFPGIGYVAGAIKCTDTKKVRTAVKTSCNAGVEISKAFIVSLRHGDSEGGGDGGQLYLEGSAALSVSCLR